MGIAEGAIGRAFARPVGSAHPRVLVLGEKIFLGNIA
jgi:hypothetical protein